MSRRPTISPIGSRLIYGEYGMDGSMQGILITVDEGNRHVSIDTDMTLDQAFLLIERLALDIVDLRRGYPNATP